jgi:hypothetical protein
MHVSVVDMSAKPENLRRPRNVRPTATLCMHELRRIPQKHRLHACCGKARSNFNVETQRGVPQRYMKHELRYGRIIST